MNWASQCRSRASMQHILLWRKIGRKMVCHTHLRFTGRPTETGRIMDGHTRGPKMHEGERELAFWTGKSGSGRYHYCTTAESKLASCFCKQSTYIRYALLLLRALVPHPHHLCIFDQSGTERRCFACFLIDVPPLCCVSVHLLLFPKLLNWQEPPLLFSQNTYMHAWLIFPPILARSFKEVCVSCWCMIILRHLSLLTTAACMQIYALYSSSFWIENCSGAPLLK